MKTKIHLNSLEAYHQGNFTVFNAREQLVLRALKDLGSATTRQIQDHLDAQEVSFVQPRISDLCRKGVIEDCGSIPCHVTGKTVRLLRIRPYSDPAQLEMFG